MWRQPHQHARSGALAFGIGTSEVEVVLATQTLPLFPFRTMAVTVTGQLGEGATAKDLALTIIAAIGTGGGQGHVIEYRGSAITALSNASSRTPQAPAQRPRTPGATPSVKRILITAGSGGGNEVQSQARPAASKRSIRRGLR